jgi:hypothetical protein
MIAELVPAIAVRRARSVISTALGRSSFPEEIASMMRRPVRQPVFQPVRLFQVPCLSENIRRLL